VAALRFHGNSVECPLCGWTGARLADSGWYEASECPICRSDIRHRLMLAALLLLPEFSLKRLVAGRKILHFAPEQALERLFRQHTAEYVSADLQRKDVDLNLDISDMPSVEPESFDLVVACDVLEHVPDDRWALREIHRVIRPGGVAVLTVPQKDHAPDTYEDCSITTPEGREAAYGQSDHLRIYGDDFADRVTAGGFRVSVVDSGSFPPPVAERYVLRPPRLSTRPLATNYRKIFFCRKE
jgi:SAM-dependent methyltransferase